MKILNQLVIIIGIWFTGELINRGTGIGIPGSVIGMLLLLVLLNYKIIKMEQIHDVSSFFLGNLAFFFIPANVLIIEYFDFIKKDLLAIFLTVFISTVLVVGVTGRVVQLLIGLTGGKSENT